MSPLPTQMINRWQNREEPSPGQGMVYWHILLGDQPEARNAAQVVQQRLVSSSGLHMPPLEWLHITILVVGPTGEITTDQQRDLLAEASVLLAELPPADVKLGRILYHPEAIAAEVQPVGPLSQIRKAVQTATLKVTGHEGHTEGPAQWIPHMTLAYSETEQPAEPLITALGRELPTNEFAINAVTLVVQQGPERLWDWHIVGQASLLDRC
ncbi:2'-5' RNA ligase family protein [Actinomadura hibisca]|uniref:2'-5' RNA ligase family protein n=1 Tax=Actinomadura hibisca TaxID=68565 RepID=UPI000A00DF48|nr:2'-5' RNA ligase family protein [Actinomadura hibisca]